MTAAKVRSTLVILETSDLHGAIFPRSYADGTPSESGLAKISTAIRRERETSDHVLYVDNGDLIQGTPLTYFHARVDRSDTANPMILGLNETGCDAAVIGNHEFNYGLPYLQNAMEDSRFPWLSANLTDDKGEPFFGAPYLVKSYDSGLKVGLLGLTTSYIPHWEREEHINGIRFQDPVAAAKRWVRHLREQECVDVVVVAYHGGFEQDLETGEPLEPLTGENQGYALCTEVPGIDVLLTGHQHRLLAASLNGVCVLQPGVSGRALGKAVLTLEKDGSRWRIAHKEAQLVPMEGIEPDKRLLQLAEPYETKTQEWLDRPMGRIIGNAVVQDTMEARLKEHPFVEWINRLQMEVSGAPISCTSIFNDDCTGFPEYVTMRHVVAAYIYPNTLKVIRVSGRDIKMALELTATYFELDESGRIAVSPRFQHPKAQPYNYDMWEGIHYRINLARPHGSRIEELSMDGRLLEPDAECDVVMNNYRASGGGSYEMFAGKRVVREIAVEMPEIIANYLLQRKESIAVADHNWEVVAR